MIDARLLLAGKDGAKSQDPDKGRGFIAQKLGLTAYEFLGSSKYPVTYYASNEKDAEVEAIRLRMEWGLVLKPCSFRMAGEKKWKKLP